MEYEINNIYCADSVAALAELPDDYVDLTVTSPPYDNLRDYTAEFSGVLDWRGIIKQLFRVTKPGGVVVWVVADATIKGSETGTSFRQALYAMDCGFNLHDTMIYQQAGTGAKGSNYAYWQAFEYMFVFSKGQAQTVNRIADISNPWTGQKRTKGIKNNLIGSRTGRKGIIGPEVSVRPNVWRYTSKTSEATDHPAPFPEPLAKDHIISWSNPGDLVLDPFVGSGTVPKMAQETGRNYLGFDLSPEYVEIAKRRVQTARIPLFAI